MDKCSKRRSGLDVEEAISWKGSAVGGHSIRSHPLPTPLPRNGFESRASFCGYLPRLDLRKDLRLPWGAFAAFLQDFAFLPVLAAFLPALMFLPVLAAFLPVLMFLPVFAAFLLVRFTFWSALEAFLPALL